VERGGGGVFTYSLFLTYSAGFKVANGCTRLLDLLLCKWKENILPSGFVFLTLVS
jgi:hypothetical protein